jgi:hypothetical protein
MNNHNSVEPQISELDFTMDRVGPGSRFRSDLEAKLRERDGELIELDCTGIVYAPAGADSRMAERAFYGFAIGGRIDLEQDDTLADVRRKLAGELREIANRIETFNPAAPAA